MNEIVLPQSLANNRRLDRWLGFEPGGTVRLAVGKVEIGQGILTALVQIAAEELDVAPGRIRITAGDTADAPDEGTTSSSLSVEVSGASVRLAAAEVRLRIVERLAQRLNCAPGEITVEDGAFQRGDAPTGHDYWNFVTPADLAADATGRAVPKSPSDYKVVGKGIARVDLPAKLGGAAFVHDITRPDMLHARILRQPGRAARLLGLDEAAIRRAAGGDFQIVREENFVAFVSANETVVQRAATAAPALARWENARSFTPAQTDAAWLVGQPSIDNVYGPKAMFRPAPMWCRPATPAPSWRMRPWARPAVSPNSATGLWKSGATRKAFTSCARRSPESSACRRKKSSSATPTALAATAITAPTTSRWTPR